MTELPSALHVEGLQYSYGSHRALDHLHLSVQAGEIFALLGPNGSGKTTLFRIISTLATIQQGTVEVFGLSVADAKAAVRATLGVVFQSPSLDPKLTVLENIRCQAALYGLAGTALQSRIDEVMQELGIQDRASTPTEDLSGGLKRRVELAKGILHRPRLLLMDEPSTGLDPASRLDLWRAIKELQKRHGVTVLMTTHLLEEADKADRIAIMDRGKTVAIGPPRELRADLGQQVLSIQTNRQEDVASWLTDQDVSVQRVDEQLRIVGKQAVDLVAPLSTHFGEAIQTLTLGQPSLEDVFVARTGHRFWNETPQDELAGSKKKRKKRRA